MLMILLKVQMKCGVSLQPRFLCGGNDVVTLSRHLSLTLY